MKNTIYLALIALSTLLLGRVVIYNTHYAHSEQPQEVAQKVAEKKADTTNDNSHKEDKKTDPTPIISQSGPDAGDNQHPSGKDRSVEPGNSGTQGKSPSDPDSMTNANGGNSGKDKIGYDGGYDKHDQDGNNGCGNDDDFEDDNNGNCGGKGKNNNKPIVSPTPVKENGNQDKNPGGCDVNGSTGDMHGKPCNPGNNHASPQGCLHGEPDCNTVTPTVSPTVHPTNTPVVTNTTVTPTGVNQTNTTSNTYNYQNNYYAYNSSSNTTNQASTDSTPRETVLGAMAPTGSFMQNLGNMLMFGGLFFSQAGLMLFRKYRN